ncbi:hypothetical protein JTE90_011021 [Oedothorax gibbosus]|uniref:Uncharacterized protein n=1 Tax=Oedothorax gibbosus TaxID=931172 RepID=A0AAV6VCQ7_9ARAC|nr:hypothetical protein JTE90_011021 [Oedothorax gibbosus]
MEHLQCGLIACETHLGWIVMGKTAIDYEDTAITDASMSIAMLIHSKEIGKVRDMEILKIKDPVDLAPLTPVMFHQGV